MPKVRVEKTINKWNDEEEEEEEEEEENEKNCRIKWNWIRNGKAYIESISKIL